MRFPALIALPLIAAGLAAAAHSGAHAAALEVPLNHSVKLAVAGRAGSVLVSNASVADVTVVDSRTVFVTGKAPGSTDVTVVDPLGRTVYAADISVSAGSGTPVTVHRGVERADLSCNPRCLAPPAGAGAMHAATPPVAGLPAVGPTDPGQSPGAQVGGLIGQAVGGALGAATSPPPRPR